MIREIYYILIGVCLTLMAFISINASMTKRKKYSLFCLTFASMMLLISEQLANLYNGTGHMYEVKIFKFLLYAMFLLVVLVFNQYVKDLLLVEGKMKEVPKELKYVDIIVLWGIVILLVSQITNLYYYYDAENCYHRTDYNFISYVFPVLAVSIQLCVLIRLRHKVSKKVLIPLYLFAAMPTIGQMLHFIFPNVTFANAAIVAMAVLLYCFSIFNTNRLVKESFEMEVKYLKEKEEQGQDMLAQSTMALVEAIDAKDKYTNGHSRRVAKYSKMLAIRMGKTEEEAKEIHMIALLHDVGKIGIPDAIINKEGKLTKEEFDTIKTHPVVGSDILRKIKISPNLYIGARWHHERYDGTGYPDNLKGEDIPEIARIISVADAYDAMASKRSYRDALPQYVIRSEFQNGIGTQFDPDIAKIMIDIIDEDVEYKLREK